MNTVDIRPLKQLVRKDFPRDAAVRKVILSEPDEVPAEEYPIKLLSWLKLMPKRFK